MVKPRTFYMSYTIRDGHNHLLDNGCQEIRPAPRFYEYLLYNLRKMLLTASSPQSVPEPKLGPAPKARQDGGSMMTQNPWIELECQDLIDFRDHKSFIDFWFEKQ